jgi:hypothetical protein
MVQAIHFEADFMFYTSSVASTSLVVRIRNFIFSRLWVERERASPRAMVGGAPTPPSSCLTGNPFARIFRG